MLMPMPFVAKAHTDNHMITVATVTAKEAFAKAIEWHISGRFTHISISDDIKTYSLDAFSLAMALLEIGKTLDTAELEGTRQVTPADRRLSAPDADSSAHRSRMNCGSGL
jgi:hypothetical protein